MRKSQALAAALLAATSFLSACNQEPEVVGGVVDRQAEVMKNRPALKELPPSIVASRVYRCADSSVVYVDFLNNKTASLRKSQTDMPIQLRASEDAGPYEGSGYTVSSNAETIRYKAPGKSEQGCHK